MNSKLLIPSSSTLRFGADFGAYVLGGFPVAGRWQHDAPWLQATLCLRNLRCSPPKKSAPSWSSLKVTYEKKQHLNMFVERDCWHPEILWDATCPHQRFMSTEANLQYDFGMEVQGPPAMVDWKSFFLGGWPFFYLFFSNVAWEHNVQVEFECASDMFEDLNHLHPTTTMDGHQRSGLNFKDPVPKHQTQQV